MEDVRVLVMLQGFGGGADFDVRGMLAGHDEGKGKIVKVNDLNISNFMDGF